MRMVVNSSRAAAVASGDGDWLAAGAAPRSVIASRGTATRVERLNMGTSIVFVGGIISQRQPPRPAICG